MTSEQAVNDFLREFKEKMEIWDVLFFDNRTKNAQALADWEVPPIQRKEALKDLKVVDYSEDPFEDEFMEGASLWVFGKMFKGKETYIKITMGQPSSPVIGISFHPAEYEMKYPFKKQ